MNNRVRSRPLVPKSLFGALVMVSVAAAALLDAGRLEARQQAPATGVDNVLIVTFDGFRWQELFGGYDASLNTKTDGGVRRPEDLAARFDKPTPEARRETLLPFFWSVVAREGQVLGDASRGSRVRVTNGFWFSYPGYNEMLSGAADPRVDSNDKKPNPNVTVLEWLNRGPASRAESRRTEAGTCCPSSWPRSARSSTSTATARRSSSPGPSASGC